MSLVSIPVKLVAQVNNGFNAEFMILAITMGGIVGTLFSILIGKVPFERKPVFISSWYYDDCCYGFRFVYGIYKSRISIPFYLRLADL